MACKPKAIQNQLDKTVPFQPFPTTGPLFDNLDLSKTELAERIDRLPGGLHSYTMTSVWRDGIGLLEQRGSGPNYQGDCLTLCTCAHQIRAGKEPNDWLDDWWVAGFTSPDQCDQIYLFYLAKIEKVYKSQAEICKALPPETLNAKTTRRNRLGDIYEPNRLSDCTDPFNVAHYFPPMIGHSHREKASDQRWLRDIDYPRYGRRASYFLAKPTLSFLWQTPLLFLTQHPRQRKWGSLAEMLDSLKTTGWTPKKKPR